MPLWECQLLLFTPVHHNKPREKHQLVLGNYCQSRNITSLFLIQYSQEPWLLCWLHMEGRGLEKLSRWDWTSCPCQHCSFVSPFPSGSNLHDCPKGEGKVQWRLLLFFFLITLFVFSDRRETGTDSKVKTKAKHLWSWGERGPPPWAVRKRAD